MADDQKASAFTEAVRERYPLAGHAGACVRVLAASVGRTTTRCDCGAEPTPRVSLAPPSREPAP